MNRTGLSVLVLVLLCLGAMARGQVTPPSAVRAVQCASVETPEQAADVVARLEGLGFGPVWTHRDENSKWIRVLVGRCERLPDAVLLKHELRAHGFADAYERAFRHLVEGDFETQAWGPGDSLFRLEARPGEKGTIKQSGREEWQPEIAVETFELFRTLDGRSDPASFEAAESLATVLDDADPLKGWMLVRANRAKVQRDLRAAPSIEAFHAVARGDVAAPPEFRLEACWLAADSWHYYYFKPLQAYRAYKEILEHYGDDPGVAARARVEIAACLLELARSEASYFNEVRRACEQIFAHVPREYTRAHAVADLMYGESWYHEGKKEQAIEHLREFVTRHPGRLREQSMAMWMAAKAAGELGLYEEACELLDPLFTVSLEQSDERFYWQGRPWRLQENTAKWMARYRGRLGDTDGYNQYRDLSDALRLLREQVDDAEGGSAVHANDELDVAFPHSLYE
ncbi:MAG: SPOR domain-containing protein, partial [Candidatus Sumerlaeia bacterium]|nr:SPOR domain-containing protein [Candidatus Sumerlaeia bacterium]